MGANAYVIVINPSSSKKIVFWVVDIFVLFNTPIPRGLPLDSSSAPCMTEASRPVLNGLIFPKLQSFPPWQKEIWKSCCGLEINVPREA
jgi:hypothetical protein